MKKKNETRSTNGLDHISVKKEGEDITTVSSHSPYYLPLYTKNLNSKDWYKFICNVKSMVRSSYEYRLWVGQCKEILNLTNCSFLGNVTDDDTDIEIHHAYLTIHDIIEIIADWMIANDIKLNSMTLAHEVMKAHYMGLVPVVPLSITVHELVHAGKIHIHYQQIYGDLKKFIDIYKAGIREEHLKKIQKELEYSLNSETLHDEKLLETNDLSQIKAVHSTIDLEKLSEYINEKMLTVDEETGELN